MSDARTQEQALQDLRRCSACGRWITTPDCDSCWVDRHQCQPTVESAAEAIRQAIELGEQARRLRQKYAQLFGDTER